MPARSILSKHIPHLPDWSVSTAFLNYSGSDEGPMACAPNALRACLCRIMVLPAYFAKTGQQIR